MKKWKIIWACAVLNIYANVKQISDQLPHFTDDEWYMELENTCFALLNSRSYNFFFVNAKIFSIRENSGIFEGVNKIWTF